VARDPAEVRIIAVTKTLPPAAVSAALAAGLMDVGENYVQEAARKRDAVAARVTWHLIGGLQRNKVRQAVAVFDRVHTVDSAALAAALEGAVAGRRLPVLIQVDVGRARAGAPTRRGVVPEGVESLARDILGRSPLALEGLMAVPPADATAESVRGCFGLLRGLRDATARRLGVELPHLSMGMSSDFTVAVEEGATWIRLGRALFGARGPAGRRSGAPVGGSS
jgi:hypothetical protein